MPETEGITKKFLDAWFDGIDAVQQELEEIGVLVAEIEAAQANLRIQDF